MIIHCETLTKNEIELIFKDKKFLLDGKKYNTLNEVLKDINIKDSELIIDASVITNTTTEELWEFIDTFIKKTKLEEEYIIKEYMYKTATLNYKSFVIESKEGLERAKNTRTENLLNISIKKETIKLC